MSELENGGSVRESAMRESALPAWAVGELHVLEQRWRDADAIAKIADDMFLPDSDA